MRLGEDDLHVWRAGLDVGAPQADRLAALLSADERVRAAGFHLDRDRIRFVAGRALLRLLLSGYTEISAAELRLEYGAHGKPRLAASDRQRRPCFNLSHSGGVALFAFSAAVELGIDLELDDPAAVSEGIPERFFSPEEVATLRSLPDGQQHGAFLEAWTRKEAFIKACGGGLTLALDRFSVTLGPGKPAALTRSPWPDVEPDQWSLLDLSDPHQGYVAAVAAPITRWGRVTRRVAEIHGLDIVAHPDG